MYFVREMLHLPDLISDLALILCTAAVVTLIFKWIKQPVVLGYIIAGLLVGPNVQLFPTVIETEGIRTWADIGVIFLMFTLGLEFSFRKLLKVGGVAVITAIFEISLTLLAGFSLGQLLGWDFMNSLFLGGILSIASTTIIIRSYDELKVRTQKFTDVVLGVLIIEDLIAVVLMVILSTIAVSRTFEGVEMAYSVFKLVFFLIIWFVSGIFFLPTLIKKIKHFLNDETLLIVSLALCFLMVMLASEAGYSSALGAFIMGSILAETTKAEKIEHLVLPIKTLFVAIFFVSVGMLIDPNTLVEHYIPVILATLILVIGKPIFVTIGALISGQPLKIAIQSGMSLSQIGEFSFIIAGLGLSLGVTNEILYPVAVAVSVLTTFTTPFMIRYSEKYYEFLNRTLPKKWLDRIQNYSLATQRIRVENNWRKLIQSYLIDTMIFSVIIITIILLSTKIISPYFSSIEGSEFIIASVSLFLLFPFLGALAFRRSGKDSFLILWQNPFFRGPLIMMYLAKIFLAIIFLGILFSQLFSPIFAVWGIVISILLLFIFRLKIQAFYSKIEDRFKKNLNERKNQTSPKIESLVPWDAHFSRFEITSTSPMVGKKLEEIKMRENFGINVALIERGQKTITVPMKTEMIYPNDILSIIGTDEQLKQFRNFLEKSELPETEHLDTSVTLQQFIIPENSELIGKNIRQSKIREFTHGLIIGIERNNQRLLNPHSNFVFEPNDLVWIAGNKSRIEIFIKNFIPIN